MAFELRVREARGARDRFEHLRRDDLDGRNEDHFRTAFQERDAASSVVDVEARSQESGYAGFTVDRPSHGEQWLRTACRPR